MRDKKTYPGTKVLIKNKLAVSFLLVTGVAVAGVFIGLYSMSIAIKNLNSSNINSNSNNNIGNDLSAQYECGPGLVIKLGDKIDSEESQSVGNAIDKQNREMVQVLKKYNQQSGPTQAATRTELLRYLQKRKEALVESMQINPEAALYSTLPKQEVDELKKLSRGCVEEQVTVEGDLTILHGDDFDAGQSQTEYTLNATDGRKLRLHPVGNFNNFVESRTKIRVKGWLLDNELVFDASRPPTTAYNQEGGVEILAQPGNPPVVGTQRIAVILSYFQNTVQPTYSLTSLKSFLTAKLDPFYKELSYNIINLTTNVYGWYQIPVNQNCLKSDLADSVKSAIVTAADPDIDFSQYDQVIMITNWTICQYAGYASIGKMSYPTQDGNVNAGFVWVPVSYSTSLAIVGHELGHNFGNNHGNYLSCGAYSYAQTGCTDTVYGDSYDIMGTGNNMHYSAPHKEDVGWLDISNSSIIDITGAPNGTYTILPMEIAGTFPKALKMRTYNNEYIYVEMRQPIGFDKLTTVTSDVFQGALAHRKFTPDVHLIDPTPPNSKTTIALKPGAPYVDPASGATFTALSATADSMVIDYRQGKTDIDPPSVTLVAPSDLSEAQGQITLTAQASDASGIEKVEFYRYYNASWKLIGTAFNAPYTATLNTTLIPNWYNTIKAKAYDLSGKPFGAWANTTDSPMIRILVYNVDSIPPVSKLTAPMPGSMVVSPVNFSAAPTDNVGVQYVAFVFDNLYTVYDRETPFSASYTLASGPHAAYAIAYDFAGNRTDSAPANFTVAPVLISAPINNAFIRGSNITISTKVSSGITFKQIEFYLDDNSTPFAIDTTAPYSAAWSTAGVPDGTHVISIKAQYASSLLYEIPPEVTIQVDNTIPVVQITNPIPGGTVKGGTNVAIQTNSSDNLKLSKVAFYVNDVYLSTAFAAPYNVTWKVPTTVTVPTVFQLKALASDQAGNIGSHIIQVTVTPP